MADVIVYDLAIVGAGMFGSSCARWASEDVRSSILIGPSEIGKASSEIFGAWFDEGRITEMADSTTVWRILGNMLLYFRLYFLGIAKSTDNSATDDRQSLVVGRSLFIYLVGRSVRHSTSFSPSFFLSSNIIHTHTLLNNSRLVQYVE